MGFAVILTIGNEIVSGDVPNTNASWLAKRLEALGFPVRLLLAVPDEIELVAEVVRRHAAEAGLMVVTGGLGGTPDDLTREALAAAFGVGQEEVPELAAELRARFARNPDYAARWAELPVGSTPLVNPLGGAPGFVLENVYVLPGLPAEMEAMWLAVEDRIEARAPIGAWRHTVESGESQIVHLLVEVGERYPDVLVGSYPSFHPSGPEVEIVLKSADAEALAAAAAFHSAELG
jgi:molybdenum cofactor synthesis domain-containing protein